MTARALIRGTGQGALVAAFLLLTTVPLVDFLGRPLAGFHIPGSATYTQQLTFYLAFLGGLVATWAGKHLTLSTAGLLPEGPVRRCAKYFSACAAAAVTAMLTYASVSVILAERQQGDLLSFGLPTWIGESVMPLALGLMTVAYVRRSSENWIGRAGALAVIAAVFALGLLRPTDSVTWGFVPAAAGGDAGRIAGLRCDGRSRHDTFLAGVHAGVGGHR